MHHIILFSSMSLTFAQKYGLTHSFNIRILFLSVEELQQSFSTELPGHVRQHTKYARNLLEYCSFRALLASCKTTDYLADKEFRILTYDMMLAWEAPDPESESLLTVRHPHLFQLHICK